MEKIGFIGSYDKTDFIIHIAKILTVMGKRVIVIDTSLVQKAKYIIPVINPTKSYVTEFEEIDVSVGFNSFKEINDYLGIDDLSLNYDIALIDVDTGTAFEKFDMYTAKLNYFVTSFDLYAIKRGVEALSNLKDIVPMKKILFSKEINSADNEYLDFLSLNYKVKWDGNIIYFPLENGDQSVLIENQRVAKVKFRNLSAAYKDSILIIVAEISDTTNLNYLVKILKNIEKGV